MNKFEQECEAITSDQYEALARELRSWAADAHLADRGQALLMAKAAIVIERLTRPDDIPASGWDAAESAVATFCNAHHNWGQLGPDKVADLERVVATAILAAVQEEREACAAHLVDLAS